MRAIVIFVTISLSALLSTASTKRETMKETLRLGIISSQQGPFDFSGAIPSIEIALETIEADETLPFTFIYTHNDSMCSADAGVRSFMDQVSSPTRQIIMLIGADCSMSTEPVAEISHRWNLVQISPASSSARLSDTRIFPHFLRTVPSDAEVAIGIIKVMKQFGWTSIALITQSENLFNFIATRLKEELAAANLQLIREYKFNSEASEASVIKSILSLKDSPARVVFLNMFSEHAAEAMCVAYKNKMYHPEYAWMFFNWYSDNWYKDYIWSSCATQNLEAVIETSIAIDIYPRIEEDRLNDLNIGNITWNYYYSEQRRRFKNTISNLTLPHTEDSAYMFDAIWTAALALNRTNSILNERSLSLLNFTYDGEFGISNIIYESALRVSFFGLTGDVYFYENGDRPGKIRLLQYRRDNVTGNLSRVQFARVINGNLVYDEGKDDNFVFEGGAFPGGSAGAVVAGRVLILLLAIIIIALTY